MKKIFSLLFVILFPTISFAYSFQLGDGTETCFEYGSPATFTTDISNPEIHFYYPADGFKKTSATSPLDWSTFAADSVTVPASVTRTVIYENGSTLVFDEFRDFTIETTCSGGGGGEETATSTATSTDMRNVEFGLGIIITMLSLGLTGFIWNSFNTKRKPWQK